jgi:hypothetical protein
MKGIIILGVVIALAGLVSFAYPVFTTNRSEEVAKARQLQGAVAGAGSSRDPADNQWRAAGAWRRADRRRCVCQALIRTRVSFDTCPRRPGAAQNFDGRLSRKRAEPAVLADEWNPLRRLAPRARNNLRPRVRLARFAAATLPVQRPAIRRTYPDPPQHNPASAGLYRLASHIRCAE